MTAASQRRTGGVIDTSEPPRPLKARSRCQSRRGRGLRVREVEFVASAPEAFQHGFDTRKYPAMNERRGTRQWWRPLGPWSTRRKVAKAVPRIIARLEQWGVVNVYWFIGFYGEPVVWLATASDADKDSLPPLLGLTEEVRACLAEVGLRDGIVKNVGVTYESEETVEREWDGNWWYAMK